MLRELESFSRTEVNMNACVGRYVLASSGAGTAQSHMYI